MYVPIEVLRLPTNIQGIQQLFHIDITNMWALDIKDECDLSDLVKLIDIVVASDIKKWQSI